MSTRVNRKRARVDDEEAALGASVKTEGDVAVLSGNDQLEAKRDGEFWYEDGTIILVAGIVEFRVYSGMLQEHSPVLKALFASPHPTRLVPLGSQPQAEFHCPVVTLSDHPEDLRHVLRMYMRNSSLFGDVDKPSFALISASLRLGQKYEMKELYEGAIAHLKTFHTTDLDRWLKTDSWTPAGVAHVEAIGIVNIARDHDLPTVYPTALLACINLPASNMLEGFARADGTQETLSPEDLALCISAKGRITAQVTAAILRIIYTTHGESCGVHVCHKARYSILYELSDNARQFGAGDPFAPFENFVQEGKLEAFCAKCLQQLRRRHHNEHHVMWEHLPDLLGVQIPEWAAGVDERSIQ